MRIALDATYSAGFPLTGVGIYSRQILWGLASAHPEAKYLFCYRPHRILRSFESFLPRGARRWPLLDSVAWSFVDVFHGLNQRLPKARHRRTVATFHDLFVLTGDYSTPEFRKRFAGQARECARASDLIITVSAFTASQVADLLSFDRSRIRVIHHGVRHPGPVALRAAAVSREKVILHVGAIQTRKNILRLVRAFESVGPEWRLALAGSVGYQGDRILAEIERSPRRQDIRVLGYVPEAALQRLYATASLLAFPSLDEGFGIPVLDAMAWGVPVLTSNRSSLPEVAGEAAILADPQNQDELTFALRTLTEQEALRRALSEKGVERAAGFSWEKAVEQTWAVYRELLA